MLFRKNLTLVHKHGMIMVTIIIIICMVPKGAGSEKGEILPGTAFSYLFPEKRDGKVHKKLSVF